MFHVNALDAMAMAIFQFEGAREGVPTVRCIRNNNPGNLRPYKQGQPMDDGYRYFDSFALGWQALLTDLSHKILVDFKGTDSTMFDLMNKYAPAGDHNNPTVYARFVCNWMSVTLGREILPTSSLTDVFQQ